MVTRVNNTIAKRVDLKRSHHKKTIVTGWKWILTKLTVLIILQYIHKSNHYSVPLNLYNVIRQLYPIKLGEKTISSLL